MRAAIAAGLLGCCLQSATPGATAEVAIDLPTGARATVPGATRFLPLQCVPAPDIERDARRAEHAGVSDPWMPPARRALSAASSVQGADADVALPAAAGGRGIKGRGVVVRIHAHVLRSKSRGGVARARIRSQVDVLNAAFAGRQSPVAAPSPFRFRLASVDVTTRRAWSRLGEGSLAESHAKRSLHRGTSEDLNVYIAMITTGVLGWGTQPTRYREQPKMDGVVVARSTLPGGYGGRHSAGDSAVHETGHWLGLLHTFAGGCGPHGDRVADTEPTARPSYDCRSQRDTCSAPGRDPVHNFMDYGDDSCMDRFTAGQVTRMLQSWERLRHRGPE